MNGANQRLPIILYEGMFTLSSRYRIMTTEYNQLMSQIKTYAHFYQNYLAYLMTALSVVKTEPTSQDKGDMDDQARLEVSEQVSKK